MRTITAFLVVLTLIFIPVDSNAGDDKSSEIHDVIERLGHAWKAGDGSAWANEFAEDAVFTVWFGLRLEGKADIAFGHQMIFDGFYKDTSFDMQVQSIRFMSDDVAIAWLAGSVTRDGEPAASEPDAVPIAVLQRNNDEWKIVAFQNTPFAVKEFGRNGDIKNLKELASQ